MGRLVHGRWRKVSRGPGAWCYDSRSALGCSLAVEIQSLAWMIDEPTSDLHLSIYWRLLLCIDTPTANSFLDCLCTIFRRLDNSTVEVARTYITIAILRNSAPDCYLEEQARANQVEVQDPHLFLFHVNFHTLSLTINCSNTHSFCKPQTLIFHPRLQNANRHEAARSHLRSYTEDPDP